MPGLRLDFTVHSVGVARLYLTGDFAARLLAGASQASRVLQTRASGATLEHMEGVARDGGPPVRSEIPAIAGVCAIDFAVRTSHAASRSAAGALGDKKTWHRCAF